MMTEKTLEEIVPHLSNVTDSVNLLPQITSILDQQSRSSTITVSLTSLTTLEQWTWRILSENSRHWNQMDAFTQFLHSLHAMNMGLIIRNDAISLEQKQSLLIPSSVDWIDRILDQIQIDEGEWITWASAWFDLLSHLSHEHPELVYVPTMIHLNNRFARDFLMRKEYKTYLQELRQIHPSPSIFTPKQNFYLNTCSYSLHVYLWSKSQNFPFTGEEIIKYLSEDFSELIRIHSKTMQSWSEQMLTCLAHVIGLVCAACWWGGQKAQHFTLLVPSADVAYENIYALVALVSYEPFHHQLASGIYNAATVLIDTSLILLYGVIETHDLACWVSSKTHLGSTLLSLVQKPCYDRIRICAYGLLAEILVDEQIKQLQIAENISESFFRILEHAWKHPTKKWKKIPINYLLKGLLSLSSNETIQSTTAKTNRLPLLIELSEQYPLVYEIIWALSFDPLIVEQLRSNSAFLDKLARNTDASLTRSIKGIWWNLHPTREERVLPTKSSTTKSYDIMISYSHKDKEICRRLYDELGRVGYRVWIDFDSMHGNVMDAMAKAIEQSRSILICMSEQYRKSNFCRAEAQYAFQKQLHIVPILLQKHYKPDGWLSFVIGAALYIDFTKYDFPTAFEMLKKELEIHRTETKATVEVVAPPTLFTSTPRQYPDQMSNWTADDVSAWLHEHQLLQLAQLLSGMNGRSLLYLYELIIRSRPEQVMASFQQDAARRNEAATISLIEIARFRSLVEENNPGIKINDQSRCCVLM